MTRRRLPIALATCGVILFWLLPLIVAVAGDRLPFRLVKPTLHHGAVVDVASPEVWTLIALGFLVWSVLTVVLLILAYDRLGYHWTYHERSPRPAKKRRRRLMAGMSFLEGQEDARRATAKRPPRSSGSAPGGKGGRPHGGGATGGV